MDDAHERSMLDLADRFFAAVAARDIHAVRGMYAPDAVVWHNYDRATQDVETNLGVLAAATSAIRDFRYEDVRRTATPSGFVSQHVLRGTAPNGEELDVPSCIVCTVRDGRITRLDEYFDAGHIAPVMGGG
jgi:ketosteroid isomerase-like protein